MERRWTGWCKDGIIPWYVSRSGGLGDVEHVSDGSVANYVEIMETQGGPAVEEEEAPPPPPPPPPPVAVRSSGLIWGVSKR